MSEPAATLLETLRSFSGQLGSSLEAELILAESLGLTRSALLKEHLLAPGAPLSEAVLTKARILLERRLRREPMAYILGRREFYGREFIVSPAVLIPRPDTELLIEKALQCCRAKPSGSFADYGTGSGAIAITLALELTAWQGLALDLSAAALEIARQNAVRLGADALAFLRADFSASLAEYIPDASLDLLLSNPPYISQAEYDSLDDDVRLYEPRLALTPGTLGTELAEAVVREAARALKPGGFLLMEMGWRQAEEYRALLSPTDWEESLIHQDLAGHDRLLQARRRQNNFILQLS